MSRISSETMGVGVLAILAGLVGAYFLRDYFTEEPVVQTPQRERPRNTVVPVAARELEPGRKIALSDILLKSMTPEQLKHANLPEGTMANPTQIIGRVVSKTMEKGQPFEATVFYPEGKGPDLSSRLEPGLRAVTTVVEENAGLQGLVAVGDSVDVIFRADQSELPAGRDYKGKQNKIDVPEVTVTLIENAEVLAWDDETSLGTIARSGPVTLAVSAEQAKKLAAVEGRGSLMLVLRNKQEAEEGSRSKLTLADILDLEALEPAKPFVSEIYRGTKVQRLEFPADTH